MYELFIYPAGTALAWLVFFRLCIHVGVMSAATRLGMREQHAGALGLLAAVSIWIALLYLVAIAFGHLVN